MSISFNRYLDAALGQLSRRVDSLIGSLAAPGTAAPIAGTLNEAWTVFWDEGSDFPAWERRARSCLWA